METPVQNTGAPEQNPAPQAEAPKADASNSDAEQNKAMAIIGYILPILFFIPLITEAKNSPFAKYHANQQLVFLLSCIAVNIVGTVIPILGWFIILPLGTILLIVLAIMGVIHAAKGEMKPLPLIGGFSILK